MHTLLLRAALCVCLTAMLCGCGGNDDDAPAGKTRTSEPVLLLAAASTQDACRAVVEQFTAQTGIAVTISPGASNQLAMQIMQGAEADVYLSANRKWANEVKKAGLSAGMMDLLGNQLALIVPASADSPVHTPQDLLNDAVHHIALAGENVPAGIYARQALRKLQLLGPLRNAHKIVTGHDVRSTMAYVERGEADAGIVYSTDAAISKQVRIAAVFSDQLHDPVVYSLVLIHRATMRADARKFYDYLQSAAAAEIFKKYGFATLAADK